MSQNNPKYKRLESLFSDARPVEPEPPRSPDRQEAEPLQMQIPEPDVKPVPEAAEMLEAQTVEPEMQPVEVEPMKMEAVTPEAQPLQTQLPEIDELLETRTVEPEMKPVEAEPMKMEAVTPEAQPAEWEPVPQTPDEAPERVAPAPFKMDTSTEDRGKVAEGEKDETHNLLALWTAGIYTFLGVVFFVFSIYNVFILQKGHFDPSDYLLTPVTIIMVAAGITGFILIRRGRLVTGLWVTYGVAIVPPIMAVLVLGNVFAIALVYITVLASVMITWVFPKSERRKAIIATIVAVLITIAIELWNPAFRFRSATLQSFAPVAIGLAVIGLVAFFVRQAAMGSIRTKLITAFALMALLSMGVVAFMAERSLRNNLTAKIVDGQAYLATSQGFQIGQAVNSELDTLRGLAVFRTIQAGVEAAGLEIEHPENVAEIDKLNQEWREALQTNDRHNPMFEQVLYHPLVSQLLKFQEAFPENSEILLTDKKGFTVAATNLPNNYYQADALWWRLAHENGQYIGQPIYNPSTNTVALDMALPIYSFRYGEFVGVLRATVNFDILTDLLVEGLHGRTGYSIIYQPNDQEILLKTTEDGKYEVVQNFASTDLRKLFELPNPSGEISLNGVPFLASYAPVSSYSSILAGERGTALDELGWQAVILQEKSEALASVNTLTRNIFALFLLTALIIIPTAIFLSRLITNPIIHLKTVAESLASGDLTAEAKVTSHDEVGTLAATFNNMTWQLRNLVGSLEQRVADRTHDLELASEVGRTVTEKVADLDDLLTTAAEMIRARFNLYYTQVYLTDPEGRLLLLRAGTGEVGEALLNRGHRLTVDFNSLNGRAVLEQKAVIVTDTLESPSFKPNPLLPKTRSEMAVPLIASGRIFGVLDMQSEEPGTLNETNLPAFEALAGQLAIAIQNARLFAETEEARAEVESQARRLARTGWEDYLNAIHRPERTGYVFDQNKLVSLEEAESPIDSTAGAISAPIEVTGEPIGTFQVELEQGKSTPQTRNLVQSVARQVAQQVENLRLLEMAERYRIEAEQITRRLTHEGWQDFTSQHGEQPLAYAYDLAEVIPMQGNGYHDDSQALAVPLSIRDESIGQLTVDKTMSSGEAREIIAAVAGQLSSHIENLRLSDQNERRAAELEQAVNRLRELDRLKSSFLANMSHELRTPLNSILGFADVMLEELDGPLTENMQNDLGLIQKNGQHLLHLINDVLDMAKIEAGRMNLNPEKFRVHEILDEVTSITSTLASEKNLSLYIESDSDHEVEIHADRTRLRQVMINLVNNSIKFTEKGKIAIRAIRTADDHVLIRVKDTGIGIPVDKLEEVFTEFAQVDSSSTRKAGGTGLGLPISRKLIEMHGGRLWAESTGVEGEGSTFLVELPLELRITEPVEKLEK